MSKRNNPWMLVDRRIENVYRKACAGMSIDIMRIPELFSRSRALVVQHASDEQLAEFMVQFVKAGE